jgi:iron complex outermembrane recepter protein
LESDRTDNFEVGGKVSLLDGRARINASLYSVDWQKIPLTIYNSQATCAVKLNAAEARSRGAELETEFHVTRNLRTQLGLSYVDAELMADVINVGAKGDRLPGSPRFSANAAVTYDFELRGHDVYTRVDLSYVGEFYNNLQEAGTAAGGYRQINVRSGFAIGALNVDFFVNNVTDADDLTYVNAANSADGRAYRLRPRTIGTQLVWSF